MFIFIFDCFLKSGKSSPTLSGDLTLVGAQFSFFCKGIAFLRGVHSYLPLGIVGGKGGSPERTLVVERTIIPITN